MTNDWLASQGVLSLKTLWAELAHLRGTAAALLCIEPTRPAPHARWCGEGARQRAGLSDIRRLSKCPVMVDGRLFEILRCSE
jgi:hypothetical protein